MSECSADEKSPCAADTATEIVAQGGAGASASVGALLQRVQTALVDYHAEVARRVQIEDNETARKLVADAQQSLQGATEQLGRLTERLRASEIPMLPTADVTASASAALRRTTEQDDRMHADLIVCHALVVTQDDARRVMEDAAVVVIGNRIAEVGSTADIEQKYAATRSLDANGFALFPGLVNIHTHLFQSAVKGLGEDMPVEKWVNAVTFPTVRVITPDEAYTLSLVSCMENLRSGATTVMDFMYSMRDPELHEAVLRAMVDSGMRGRYTRTIVDSGEELGVPVEMRQSAEEALVHAKSLHAKWNGAGGGRIDVGLAVGVIWGVSEEGMRSVRRVADETGMTITMHVNESPFDNVMAQAKWGVDTVPMLDATGMLGPDFIAAHCVHMTEEDMVLFTKHGVAVAYNPVSNMYLGSGVPPIVQLESAGLTVGLGTDGSGSNNCQDMLETLKCSALLQKVGRNDASCVLAQRALDWATRGGAAAMGISDRVGTIAPGMLADFFLLNPFTPKTTPVHDPIATLVYSAGQSAVDTVVVDGRVLLQQGRFVHLDEVRLLREAQLAAQRLAQRAGTDEHLQARGIMWRPL